MPSLDIVPHVALEPNWYTMTCRAVEVIEKESTFKAGEKYRQVQWTWSVEIADGPAVRRLSWTTVPRDAALHNDTVKACIALGLTTAQQAQEDGLHVELDDAINRKCRGLVTLEVGKNNQSSDKITDYAPLSSKAGARPAPAPAPLDDDTADIPF